MAIPSWVDPDGPEADVAPEPAASGGLSALDVEDATEAFGLLSNATRVEILAALAGRSGPTSYTALQRSISVEDSGRFNYHLRQLDGLVESREGEYALTDRGEALVEQVLAARTAVGRD